MSPSCLLMGVCDILCTLITTFPVERPGRGARPFHLNAGGRTTLRCCLDRRSPKRRWCCFVSSLFATRRRCLGCRRRICGRSSASSNRAKLAVVMTVGPVDGRRTSSPPSIVRSRAQEYERLAIVAAWLSVTNSRCCHSPSDFT